MSMHNPNKYINRLKDKFPTLYQELVNRNVHPVHIAFELINHDVQVNQVLWNKCLDCGQPYVVGEEHGSNGTFCSEQCERATREYLGI